MKYLQIRPIFFACCRSRNHPQIFYVLLIIIRTLINHHIITHISAKVNSICKICLKNFYEQKYQKADAVTSALCCYLFSIYAELTQPLTPEYSTYAQPLTDLRTIISVSLGILIRDSEFLSASARTLSTPPLVLTL